MVKRQVSHTIDTKLLKMVENFKEKNYPTLARSAVIEILLREALLGHLDLAVAT